MPQDEGGGPVERARSLVGIRFRPQGRSADQGLDCVGLSLLAFGLGPDLVRANYSLAGSNRTDVEPVLAGFFERIAPHIAWQGDLMLVQPGLRQVHLLILTSQGFVHADATLRRVVEVPGKPPWPIVSAWRQRQGENG